MMLLVCLATVDKGTLNISVPIFKKITTTTTEVVQVSFLTVGCKQKNKIELTAHMAFEHTEYMASSYHSKVGLLKALESHFSLVWGMKNGIIYPRLGNGKVFTDNFNLINLLTFNFCMKTVRKLNVLGVYTISKTFLSFHTTLLKCFI